MEKDKPKYCILHNTILYLLQITQMFFAIILKIEKYLINKLYYQFRGNSLNYSILKSLVWV